MNLDSALDRFLALAPNIFTPIGAVWIASFILTGYFLFDCLTSIPSKGVRPTSYEKGIYEQYRRNMNFAFNGFAISATAFFLIWLCNIFIAD